MPLRLAIFGQAPIAKESIDRLLAAGHAIPVVYAPQDGSRPDALAAHARGLGLDVVQRRYFRKKGGMPIESALAEYRSRDVDLNVLASFTSFLPGQITDAPAHKSICFHPSLLPLYRGGNAMQWQIIDGALETGVSIFVPDAGVDEGPVVVQKGGLEIGPQDTTGSLFFKKLAPLAVEAIVEAVTRIDDGTASPVVQDESTATFQGLVTDADAAIDLSRPADVIDRLVRGCDPQPGAHLRLGDLRVRLYDVALEAPLDAAPGTVTAIGDDGAVIAFVGGSLRVGRVRGDAGKEPASQFADRDGVSVGASFSSGE